MIDDNEIEVQDTPVEELDYILPDDYVEEEEAETDEIEEETEATEEETAEEPVEESWDDLELNVLGVKTKLKDHSKEEAKERMQKGFDYDRIKEKNNTMQDDLNEWSEISEMFGMSLQEVKDSLRDQHFKDRAEAEERNFNDVKSEYTATRKSNVDKMYERFVAKHPSVDTDSLPAEVIDAVKSGKDLLTVYDKHMGDTEISQLKSKITELEAKVGVKTQNDKAKKKGVIKKVSNSGTDTPKDDFLQGLLGDDY